MPFNEKGEFIRSGAARPRSVSPPIQTRRQVSRSSGRKGNAIWWWLGWSTALVGLVGIVWAMWIFRQWVMFAFGLWAAAQICQKFR